MSPIVYELDLRLCTLNDIITYEVGTQDAGDKTKYMYDVTSRRK